MNLDQARQEMAELHHSSSTMNYGANLLGLIEAHRQLERLSHSKQPNLSDEQNNQRKMLIQLVMTIVRNEVKVHMRNYFLPEYEKWLEVTGDKG